MSATIMGEVRSIDASQLPTDLKLMGILKNAVKKVPILYAFLEYHHQSGIWITRLLTRVQ